MKVKRRLYWFKTFEIVGLTNIDIEKKEYTMYNCSMILRLMAENYRSIEKVDIWFNKMNVLVGKNGAGKTTLISIIELVKEIASGKDINAIINEDSSRGGLFNVNVQKDNTRVELLLQTPDDQQYVYSFSIGVGSVGRDGAYYFSEESLCRKTEQGEDNVFERDVKGNTIKVGPDRVSVPQRVAGGVAVLSMFAQEQTRMIADLLSSYSVIWLDGGVSNEDGWTVISANDLDLSRVDDVAVGLYLKDASAFSEAVEQISEIIPGFEAPLIRKLPFDTDDNVNGASRVGYVVGWHDCDYAKTATISSSSLSGGNSRVIYLILSLYFSDAKSCFVAEEIENGMHAARLSILMDKLRMIGKNRKIQLFFTTHSHLILNDLLPMEVILAKLGENGSEYVRLSDSSEYSEIVKDLGRQPTSKEIAESGLVF